MANHCRLRRDFLGSTARLDHPSFLQCPAVLQKKIEYVLQKAGAKGQLAIIGFLILVLIILIFLVIA